MADSAVPPMVLQNKLDVYHVGKQLDPAGDDIVSYARSRSIVIVAYSPFSAYPFVMEPLEDPLVRRAAFALKITPAQVLLKWTIQSGFAAIPRSTNPIHMKENVEGIDLPELMPGLFGMLSILTTLVSSPVSRVSV
jgi:diketogulonate reductase-like aldo/keto reductase